MSSKVTGYQPKTHTIAVTVGKDSIRVEPDTLTMTLRDDVKWSGSGQKFSIVFDGTGPFATRELGHDAATRSQRPGTKGHFKYSVVSAADPKVKLDPIIIVEEPPSGPVT